MIRIHIVGDIMPGDQFCSFGFGVRSRYSGIYGELIPESIAKKLIDADLLIGNLECSFNNSQKFKLESHRLCADREALQWLKQVGFDMVSLANNHTLERGNQGFKELQTELENAGIDYFGSGKEPFSIREIDGMKVGFYGFSAIDDFKNTDSIELFHEEKTIKKVERYSRKTDHLIVFPHWGNEFIHSPSVNQKEIGRACIEAGASAVVGTHPHVIQPLEEYHGGVIIYSTGNFIFDSYSPITFPTACFSLEFEKGKPPRVGAIPLMADRTYRIREADNYEAKTIHQLFYTKQKTANYTEKVLKSRSAYRRETLVHLMKNAFRFRDKLGVLKWALNRIRLYLKNRKSERENPSNVYKWN